MEGYISFVMGLLTAVKIKHSKLKSFIKVTYLQIEKFENVNFNFIGIQIQLCHYF